MGSRRFDGIPGRAGLARNRSLPVHGGVGVRTVVPGLHRFLDPRPPPLRESPDLRADAVVHPDDRRRPLDLPPCLRVPPGDRLPDGRRRGADRPGIENGRSPAAPGDDRAKPLSETARRACAGALFGVHGLPGHSDPLLPSPDPLFDPVCASTVRRVCSGRRADLAADSGRVPAGAGSPRSVRRLPLVERPRAGGGDGTGRGNRRKRKRGVHGNLRGDGSRRPLRRDRDRGTFRTGGDLPAGSPQNLVPGAPASVRCMDDPSRLAVHLLHPDLGTVFRTGELADADLRRGLGRRLFLPLQKLDPESGSSSDFPQADLPVRGRRPSDPDPDRRAVGLAFHGGRPCFPGHPQRPPGGSTGNPL